MGDLIQVDNAAQGIPGAASLIPFLLTGWYLAPTAAIAAEALEQDRSLPYAQRRNLVTPAGDLFKADGEVVGRVKVGPLGDPLQPYFVMETCTDVGSTTQGAAHEVAEASALLQEQIMAERDAAMVIAEQLSAQRARLAERLCEAQAALDGCESKRRMLSQELRSLERKVSQQKVTLQAATAALQKDSARLAVAQADTAALVQRVAQATEAVVMRKGELVAAEEAYMAQAGATEGGAALLEHEKMMEEAETALQREAVRQEDLKVQYAQLHQQLTTVQANEEAIRKAQAWQEGAEEKLKEAETAGKTAKNVLKKARRSRMKAEAASNNADADWRDAIQ